MELELENHTVLVMGGSRGLGRAVAEALSREGARVLVTSRSEASAEQAARALPGPGRGVPLVLDTGRTDSVAAFSAALQEAVPKGLYGVFVNTGGPPAGSFGEMSIAEWNAAAQQLLLGPVAVLQAALPLMPGPGAIVFNASSSIRVPIPRLILSNVIRPALLALTKCLADELAPRQIRVNMVAPGRIATDRLDELDQIAADRSGDSLDAVRARQVANIPMGRYGDPDEYGRVAGFLFSPKTTYVTGQAVLVDGGMVRSLP